MITNRQLLLPYAAPYLAYAGIASIPRDYLSAEASYLLRLVVVPLLVAAELLVHQRMRALARTFRA